MSARKSKATGPAQGRYHPEAPRQLANGSGIAQALGPGAHATVFQFGDTSISAEEVVALLTTRNDPSFPFLSFRDVEDLPHALPRFHGDELSIPYQSRLPEEIRHRLDSAALVLVRGRTGLGKTREALEWIRRWLERCSPEPVVILVPRPPLTPPEKLTWPQGLPNRHVVLLLDDLHLHYAADGDDGKKLFGLDDYRKWLPGMIDALLRRYSDGSVRVIATIRDDLPGGDWQSRIEFGEPFWRRFDVVALPTWHSEDRQSVASAAATWHGLNITADVSSAIASRVTDGTARSIINPLKKMERGQTVSVRQVAAWPASFLDQVERDWREAIAPYPEREVLFRTVSTLTGHGFTPYSDIVVEVATRALKRRFNRVARWQVRRALRRVDSWITSEGPILKCAEAYLRDFADTMILLTNVIPTLCVAARNDAGRLAPDLEQAAGWIGVLLESAHNTEGVQAGLFSLLAHIHRATLAGYSRKEQPLKRALTARRLSEAVLRANGDRNSQKTEALRNLTEAGQIYREKELWQELAATLARAAEVFLMKEHGDPEKQSDVETAIDLYKGAVTYSADEEDKHITMIRLGNVYVERLTGDRERGVEEALIHYQEALRFFEAKGPTVSLIAVLNQMGNAYASRVKGLRAENLRLAIDCYRRALDLKDPAVDAVAYDGFSRNLQLARADLERATAQDRMSSV